MITETNTFSMRQITDLPHHTFYILIHFQMLSFYNFVTISANAVVVLMLAVLIVAVVEFFPKVFKKYAVIHGVIVKAKRYKAWKGSKNGSN